ncbi:MULTISPECIES: sulfite exporter TauE/SafE family protein [Sporosarcina]|uniref:sulfite exporter TauE/SafE family protein n=1 Tax=Sporosarcina TaxID=1569 RepID=UPI00058EB0A1|nr:MULTISPECIES: sulfite exporter TauE/SafE family protein [Sporosarcina]WJY26254.1 sulfite exporter TauE/SafE family protein [Sporosarcina sp. 0.2-SM1T-5]
MTVTLIAVLFVIGFAGSFLSGMAGIGGAIVKYPMLLYIPPLFGLSAFTAHEVSGITAVEIFFASIAGVFAYRGTGLLHRQLILWMGGAVILGSFLGGLGSGYLSEQTVNLVYGVLAAAAAVLLFIPRKKTEDRPAEEVTFNKWLAAGIAFVIGAASGVVGAGGAFILVPVMLAVFTVPVRIAAASSLAITFLSSIGSAAGKIATGQILWGPAAVLIAAALIASPLGAKAARKTDPRIIKWILAVLVLATAVNIWSGLL